MSIGGNVQTPAAKITFRKDPITTVKRAEKKMKIQSNKTGYYIELVV